MSRDRGAQYFSHARKDWRRNAELMLKLKRSRFICEIYGIFEDKTSYYEARLEYHLGFVVGLLGFKMLTRSIVDGYFDPLVFWHQREYLRTSIFFCRVSKIGNAKRNTITISSKVHEWLVLSFLFNHIWKDYEDRLV